jgi:hypothetical protein
MRAGNAPAQRCRGLAELALRWSGVAAEQSQAGPAGAEQSQARPAGAEQSQAGPAAHVLEAVRAAATHRRRPLWPLVRASPWIGRGRAQVVVVNVLLPFAAAAGVVEANEVYERLSGEPSNRVVRYMARQLAAPGVRFTGACRQQGLLHLFKMTCAARVCERCPARAVHRNKAGARGV